MNNDFDFYNFILQKHKFRIDSNKDVYFALSTDGHDGIRFFSDGKTQLTCSNTFHEVLGRKIKPFGRIPAKVIDAENGDIILVARNGSIRLQAANVIIDAVDALDGEITLNASRTVQLSAPTINGQGDNITLAASNVISTAGGTNETYSEVSTEQATGTDFFKASFFGKILSAIKKFKAFFESKCGGE